MKISTSSLVALAAASVLSTFSLSAFAGMSPTEKLGDKLYHDKKLSEPNGQACASCHLEKAGLADPDQDIPVSEGVIPGLFGSRNSPTAGYAMYSPIFHFDSVESLWIGGQFLDGRATGNTLGDPLADQALGPFLNPVEMANTTKVTVVRDAKKSKYSKLFRKVCGDVNLKSSAEVDAAYDCIASSIGAFERTKRFGLFTSRYDKYLKNCANRTDGSYEQLDDCAKGIGRNAQKAAKKELTKNQFAGLKLFVEANNNNGVFEPGEGAGCAACHVADWTHVSDYSLKVQEPKWSPDGWIPPVFTDFTFDNLGIPKSEHPLLVKNPVDLGLGAQVFDAQENGKFKVSGLRNLTKTAPYGHNGFFATLADITHFYNTRDTENWPIAEVPETQNASELGSLGLSAKQEKQLVQFMKTLTDGYFK
ncbi:MAG: cytochrome-c peroxidase [bacterium]